MYGMHPFAPWAQSRAFFAQNRRALLGDVAPPLTAYRIADPHKARCAILEAMAQSPVHSAQPLGQMFASVSGAVERGHYVLARRGARVAGYLGYGLCAPDVVAGFWDTGIMPPSALCRDGDVVLVFDTYAPDLASALFLARTLARLHPSWQVAGRRSKGGVAAHYAGRLAAERAACVTLHLRDARLAALLQAGHS